MLATAHISKDEVVKNSDAVLAVRVWTNKN